MPDQRQFRNEDLVLQVSRNLNPARLDLNRYEPFLDALCVNREYQKEAVRVVLRYFLGGRYSNLRQLAEENFNSSERIRDRYTTFREMERHLQFPNQLSCSVDLATATGKSFAMYAIARIMLAEGVVDRVLILCPSRTIEKGLTEKFRSLSAVATYKELLPEESRIRNPHIINGSSSIVDGDICIENFHATLQHVKSSIRDSLAGKGVRTLVLNDEVHHVYNPSGKDLKRWKEFLLDPEFGFQYIAGFSGTCYIGDDYFADVVSRYSLRQAMEEGYAKIIEYVAEDISATADEKFQKIYDNHIQNKTQFYRKVKPLTILIARDIAACEQLTDDLIEFLAGQEGIPLEDAAKKVLIVTSSPKHAANVRELDKIDQPKNHREWITSVSMLTEGWDVQNVFQIVPHEERAFNSKLLIAQVLGRGLRIPEAYKGEKPVVTVFNHDAWSSRIKYLVDEVMEMEKRLYSYPVAKSPDYNFRLHHLHYDQVLEVLEEHEQTTEYKFKPISLASQKAVLERGTVYATATTGLQREKKTLVRYQMFSVDEVAEHVYNHYSAIDLENEGRSNFAEQYSLESIRELIRASLRKAGESEDMVSAENRQKILRGFGVTQRGAAKRARYKNVPNALYTISTSERQKDSVSEGALRRQGATVYFDDDTFSLSDEDTQTVLQEVLDDENMRQSSWKRVDNAFLFKTPLNLVIADHKPEREFVRHLIKQENAAVLDAWVKSTDTSFYPIAYSWRKGEHPKRGFFNPDFFIKKSKNILVIEIKGDEEIAEPSDENKGKFKHARQHFETLNSQQNEIVYFFHFLTPSDYDKFFQFLREGNYSFVSELDAILDGSGNGNDS
ncbi:MAG: DEAD/DEAH box helicase family protein [Anaerolineales bacterium]|nr:DEAD/DEAH box helicase family protein [Anaerolineales bacterium]